MSLSRKRPAELADASTENNQPPEKLSCKMLNDKMRAEHVVTQVILATKEYNKALLAIEEREECRRMKHCLEYWQTQGFISGIEHLQWAQVAPENDPYCIAVERYKAFAQYFQNAALTQIGSRYILPICSAAMVSNKFLYLSQDESDNPIVKFSEDLPPLENVRVLVQIRPTRLYLKLDGDQDIKGGFFYLPHISEKIKLSQSQIEVVQKNGFSLESSRPFNYEDPYLVSTHNLYAVMTVLDVCCPSPIPASDYTLLASHLKKTLSPFHFNTIVEDEKGRECLTAILVDEMLMESKIMDLISDQKKSNEYFTEESIKWVKLPTPLLESAGIQCVPEEGILHVCKGPSMNYCQTHGLYDRKEHALHVLWESYRLKINLKNSDKHYYDEKHVLVFNVFI